MLAAELTDTSLFQQLGSPSVATRDFATDALVRMGTSAQHGLCEILKGDHDRSLIARAAFTLAGIRPIEQEALWSASRLPFLAEPSSGTVAQLLAWLYTKHRIRAGGGDIDVNRVVRAEAECGNVLAYLDSLCHALGGSWISGEDGMIQLSSYPEPAFPVCYVGPFRIRLTSTETLHATDYRSSRHVATLGLDVTALSMLSPIGDPRLSDLVACDEHGLEHRFRVFPPAPTDVSTRSRAASLPSLARARDVLTRGLIEPPAYFLATTEIPIGTRRFDWLRGEVRFVYTATYSDVVIDDLSPGHRVTCCDGTEIQIDASSEYDCTLSICSTDWEPTDGSEREGQVISTVALGIDQEGKDCLATPSRWLSTGSDKQRRTAIHLFIDNRVNSPLRELRLRIIGELREVVVPFRFEGIALP